MILADFKDFPCHGRLIGIDWGARRIGIAVSDDTQEFVFTRPQVENKPWSRAAVASVAQIIEDEDVIGIVIGLPMRSDGTESDTTLAVKTFASGLTTYTDLPIIFVEENLTSIEAGEHLSGIKWAKAKEQLDSESAKIILENAIALVRRKK